MFLAFAQFQGQTVGVNFVAHRPNFYKADLAVDKCPTYGQLKFRDIHTLTSFSSTGQGHTDHFDIFVLPPSLLVSLLVSYLASNRDRIMLLHAGHTRRLRTFVQYLPAFFAADRKQLVTSYPVLL